MSAAHPQHQSSGSPKPTDPADACWQFNLKLLDILGLAGQSVTGLSIKLGNGAPPHVVIERLMTTEEMGLVVALFTRERHTLWPDPYVPPEQIRVATVAPRQASDR